jgi:hypothetical protein
MVHFHNSYIFGKREEVLILPIISEHFGREIKPYEERYAKHDFYCTEYNYEVKSRTNTFAKYPTTMITSNKVTGDKKLIFVFNFVDCLAVIEYNEERFAKYERQMFSRAQIETDEKVHLFIPIGDLEIIKRKDVRN